MKEIILMANQCLQDIPVQVYGNAQALWIILEDNPQLGADLEKPFVPAGTAIKVRTDLYQNPDAIPTNVVVYEGRRHKPALGERQGCGVGFDQVGVDNWIGVDCGFQLPPTQTGIGYMTISGTTNPFTVH